MFVALTVKHRHYWANFLQTRARHEKGFSTHDWCIYDMCSGQQHPFTVSRSVVNVYTVQQTFL